MKIYSNPTSAVPRLQGAFSLVEAIVGVAIMSVVITSLYGTISQGFSIVQMARENLRATQILLEKTENLRLYTLEQVTNQNWGGLGADFLPRTFTERFYPIGQWANQGVTYTGAVTIAKAPVSTNYTNDLMQVSFTLSWVSGGTVRQRSVDTLVARYGIQRYVF